MKKIKLMLALSLICLTATSFGQIQKLTTRSQTGFGVIKAADTTINADTTYLILDTNYNNGGGTTPGSISSYGDVIVNWTNTQLTGTSGGSVIFQGSMTGVFAVVGDWVTLVCDKNGALVKDTVTVSGTTGGTFIIPNCKFRYIRARYISSGTQTSTLVGTAWLRRHD